jgi:hypothetical protein
MGKIILGIPLAFLLAICAVAQQSAPADSGGVAGFVRQPNGTPIAGATVTASAVCKGDNLPPDRQVKTADDGSFLVLPFTDSGCNRVQLSAGKEDEMWRTTGDNPFDKGGNGTTPIVTTPRSGVPAKADIVLGARGGALSLRVKDSVTGQFIWSQLHVERVKVANANLGTMDIETDRDGGANTLLLPVGQYEVSVQMYECKDVRYQPLSPPREIVTIESGKKIEKEITVNLRLLKPDLSSGNQRPCKL